MKFPLSRVVKLFVAFNAIGTLMVLACMMPHGALAVSRSPVSFTIGDLAGDFVKENETGNIWYIDVKNSRRHQIVVGDPYAYERMLALAEVKPWPAIAAVPLASASSSLPTQDLKLRKVRQPAIRGVVIDENAPDVLWHIRRRANLRQRIGTREELLAYVANAMEVKSVDLYEYPIASADFDYTVKDPAKISATSTTMLRPDAAKFIRISLKEQRIRAYENGKLVNTFLISSGRGKYPTPRGEFSVLDKLPTVNYQWTYGKDSPDNFDLGIVPFNLRIMPHKYIHYAYWHNNFGHPMSHGCINVSLKNIKWIYRWAEKDIPVFIHY